MYKYDIALVDAQWVLTRNHYAMCGGNRKTEDNYPKELVASCVSSILSMLEWATIGKIILLWDTFPYHKHMLLGNDYKTGRSIPTEEDIESAETEEEKQLAENAVDNFNKRGIAKSILKDLSQIALPSIARPGYEADDLAYLVSNYLAENNKTTLLVSVDSDWKFWMSPKSTLYNPKSDEMYTPESVRKDEGIPEYLGLFEYKSYYDSFYGSHNDLYQTVNEEGYDMNVFELIELVKKEGFTTKYFSEPIKAKCQFDSFNFDKYPDSNKVKAQVESSLFIGRCASKGQVEHFNTDRDLDLNTSKFTHYYKTLNRSLFHE